MDDRARWNKTISDAARIRQVLDSDGGEVIHGWLLERMELVKNQLVEQVNPLATEDYRNKWAEYKAYRDLYVLLSKQAFDKEKVARKKLDELDSIESASQL